MLEVQIHLALYTYVLANLAHLKVVFPLLWTFYSNTLTNGVVLESNYTYILKDSFLTWPFLNEPGLVSRA